MNDSLDKTLLRQTGSRGEPGGEIAGDSAPVPLILRRRKWSGGGLSARIFGSAASSPMRRSEAPPREKRFLNLLYNPYFVN